MKFLTKQQRRKELRRRVLREKHSSSNYLKPLPELRMLGWTFPDRRTLEDIAAMVVLNGKPFKATVTNEGNVESGPYTLVYRGVRLGQAKVYSAPNGDLWLEWPEAKPLDEYSFGYCMHRLDRKGTVAGMLHVRVPEVWVKAS